VRTQPIRLTCAGPFSGALGVTVPAVPPARWRLACGAVDVVASGAAVIAFQRGAPLPQWARLAPGEGAAMGGGSRPGLPGGCRPGRAWGRLGRGPGRCFRC